MHYVKELIFLLPPESIKRRGTQIFCNSLYVLWERTSFFATIPKHKMKEYSEVLPFYVCVLRERTTYYAATKKIKTDKG